MINLRTKINLKDNTNIKMARCIRNNHKKKQIGSLINVVVTKTKKSVLLESKSKKSLILNKTIQNLIVLSKRNQIIRYDGSYWHCSENSGVLINLKNSKSSTKKKTIEFAFKRINCYAPLELKNKFNTFNGINLLKLTVGKF